MYLFRCLHAMHSESMAVLTPIISYQMAIIRYNLVREREREKMMHCLLYYHWLTYVGEKRFHLLVWEAKQAKLSQAPKPMCRRHWPFVLFQALWHDDVAWWGRSYTTLNVPCRRAAAKYVSIDVSFLIFGLSLIYCSETRLIDSRPALCLQNCLPWAAIQCQKINV